MKLHLETKDGNNGYLFSTKAKMEGDTCGVEDNSFRSFGFSQAKDNKIYYGGSKVNNFVFNRLSNQYYIDDDNQMDKLFI